MNEIYVFGEVWIMLLGLYMGCIVMSRKIEIIIDMVVVWDKREIMLIYEFMLVLKCYVLIICFWLIFFYNLYEYENKFIFWKCMILVFLYVFI